MSDGSTSGLERWLAVIASIITIVVFATGTMSLRECAKDNRAAQPPSFTGTVEPSAPPKADSSETAATLPKAAPVMPTPPAVSLANVVADIDTTAGTISLKFFPDVAPNNVRNFLQLAQSGFYDGTKFHYIKPGFMILGGDPKTISGPRSTWGDGGSGRSLAPEFNDISHHRGILSMPQAAAGGSSQFFICVADSAFLDHVATVIGEVTAGMDVADNIAHAPRDANDCPNDPVTIRHIKIRSSP